MNCLNRVEIQKYIDGEINWSATDEIKKHLESCSNCLRLYHEAVNDKDLINRMLDEAIRDNPELPVPDFNLPRNRTKRGKYLRIFELLAAASIIGFIFILQKANRSPEKMPQAEIILYDFYDGQDLNKMWHEKSQIIILQDQNGNIIEPVINY